MTVAVRFVSSLLNGRPSEWPSSLWSSRGRNPWKLVEWNKEDGGIIVRRQSPPTQKTYSSKSTFLLAPDWWSPLHHYNIQVKKRIRFLSFPWFFQCYMKPSFSFPTASSLTSGQSWAGWNWRTRRGGKGSYFSCGSGGQQQAAHCWIIDNRTARNTHLHSLGFPPFLFLLVRPWIWQQQQPTDPLDGWDQQWENQTLPAIRLRPDIFLIYQKKNRKTGK